MSMVSYKIQRKCGTLCPLKDGWNKELRIISWDNGPDEWDVRSWNKKTGRMKKGIHLSDEVMERVVDAYIEWRANSSFKDACSGKPIYAFHDKETGIPIDIYAHIALVDGDREGEKVELYLVSRNDLPVCLDIRKTKEETARSFGGSSGTLLTEAAADRMCELYKKEKAKTIPKDKPYAWAKTRMDTKLLNKALEETKNGSHDLSYEIIANLGNSSPEKLISLYMDVNEKERCLMDAVMISLTGHPLIELIRATYGKEVSK